MNKPKVFVIMPFTDDFFESYEMIKEHFSENFEFSHAGDEDNQQNILADIILPIYSADIVLADLTGLNPNVMYELGIAHSFNKKTIMITRDELSSLPFDLKQYRAKDYSTHFKKFYELIIYLEKIWVEPKMVVLFSTILLEISWIRAKLIHKSYLLERILN